MLDRFERDDDRGKSLDGKLAALFAGIVASIGFSFRAQVTAVSAGAALLYLVPLALVAWAYTAKLGKVGPTAESIEASFPAYPVSTLVEAIKAMRIANAANVDAHDRKAAFLDYAVIATVVVTLVILVTQFFASLGFIEGGAGGSRLHGTPRVERPAPSPIQRSMVRAWASA